MQRYGIFHYRQAETGASRRSASPFVDPIESFEYMGHMLRRDAYAIVGKFDRDVFGIIPLQLYPHRCGAAIGYGVVQEIVYHGKKQRSIA